MEEYVSPFRFGMFKKPKNDVVNYKPLERIQASVCTSVVWAISETTQSNNDENYGSLNSVSFPPRIDYLSYQVSRYKYVKMTAEVQNRKLIRL